MAWPGSPGAGRVGDHRGCGGCCGTGRWGWTPTGAGAQQHPARVRDGVPTAGVPAAGVPTARPLSSAGSWVSQELPALPGMVLGELPGGAGWGRAQQGGSPLPTTLPGGWGAGWSGCPCPRGPPAPVRDLAGGPAAARSQGRCWGQPAPPGATFTGGPGGARAAPSQGWCRPCCLPGPLPPAVPDPRHRPHRAAAGNKGLQRGCAQR